MVSHKMARDNIGHVTGIIPEELTCLPLPTTTPSKKKYSLENMASYINIDAANKSKHLQIVHNLVYRAQNIMITYTHLQRTEHNYYRHTYTCTHTSAQIDMHSDLLS